jgi:glycosyltransferase involved in cell wall biosynthesis
MISANHKRKLVLVFLGRKGGGAQLLYSILNNFGNYEIEVWVSKRLDLTPIAPSEKRNLVVYEIPHGFIEILNPMKFFQYSRSVLKLLLKSAAAFDTTFVQIMPSPTDFFVDIGAKVRSNRVIRFIHDMQPHKGESWPTKKAIDSRVKRSDHVVAFSNHIASKINQIDQGKLHVSELPSVHYQSREQISIGKDLSDCVSQSNLPVILFIGRIIEYKGLEGFLAELALVRLPYKFVIVGEGKVPRQWHKNSNLFFVNRWVNDQEFNFAIKQASLLVFPYLESSQSGVIPIAMGMSKYILSTTVAGISEQLYGYEKSFRFKVISKADIESVILKISTATEENSEESIADIETSNSADLIKLLNSLR